MADIKIGIMRECPQVRTYIKEIERAGESERRERERQRERINPAILSTANMFIRKLLLDHALCSEVTFN